MRQKIGRKTSICITNFSGLICSPVNKSTLKEERSEAAPAPVLVGFDVRPEASDWEQDALRGTRIGGHRQGLVTPRRPRNEVPHSTGAVIENLPPLPPTPGLALATAAAASSCSMPPLLDMYQCNVDLWEEGTVQGYGLRRRARFRAVRKTRRGAAEKARGRTARCGTARGARLGRRRAVRSWGARVWGPFYVSWAQQRPLDLKSRVRMTWAEHSNRLILRFRPITVWCYLYF